MIETIIAVILGAVAAYFVLAFLITAIVTGVAFYVIWKMTK